jgi:hypothetical protein
MALPPSKPPEGKPPGVGVMIPPAIPPAPPKEVIPPTSAKYRLPLIVTCIAVEPGAPTVLDCTIVDALGQTIRARGHMRINVSQSTTYEQAAAILQSYAGSVAKDLLAAGKAERAATSDNPTARFEELTNIVDKEFIGSAT